MNSKNEPDLELVKAAKKDISNFKFLYEKYLKAVFRYCYNRLGRNKELAEDITSDTFVKAIEKFDSYNYQSKPFVVWLYTIAHNSIVDYYRSKKERNVSFNSLPTEPAQETESIIDTLSNEELLQCIKDLSSEIPDEVNSLFTFRFTEELTFAEIARLTGKTEGAVKMQYYRGMELFKKLVEEKYSNSS